ncbi:MAG: protein kinase [Planctomycetes bacterium]|nr:protein kinase [Planctomycetota bacterium]
MRLTVENGPLAGTTIPLDRDQPTYLGSGADCALRIQEPGVADRMAVVKALRDQGFGLKALQFGVRVNGESVEASPLKDGDVVEIGTTRIAFGELQQRGVPKIPGYRILGELGRGGMGMVYRAEQTSLHRQVALKVLSGERTRDPAFVAKFVAEARAAAKLQHPNVVQVFDVDHDGEIYFFAMEVMQGSLEGWLKQNGAMPVERAMQVVSDAASGLAYAESLGIVHRDIKPDNLMLDQHGAVKIADLGLASTVEETEDKAVGTPHFMAPEQVLRKAIDHRTDLYALGCTFYRLVTGKTPFRGQTVKDILRAQVKDDPEPANKANPQVPAEVAAIIGKLMQKAPEQRYQTANDLLEDLAAQLQPPAKKGLWIGLAVVAGLVASGAVGWALTRPKEIVTVERPRYDDPEKQRLSDENLLLKADQKQDRAKIALLEARLVADAPARIAALEAVATQFAGTAAADEGKRLADAERQAAAAQASATAQLAERRQAFLSSVQQGLNKQLAAGQFRAALQSLTSPPPEDLRGDREVGEALVKLQNDVEGAARTALAELGTAVEKARSAGDEAALQNAMPALEDALAKADRWPLSLAGELEQQRAKIEAGKAALVTLRLDRTESVWRQYATMLGGEDGVLPRLRALDFRAAAASAERFAASAAESPAGLRAKAMQGLLLGAATFANELEQAIAQSKVALPMAGTAPLTLHRWDKASGQFVHVDDTKKPAKETSVALADLSLEQWLALAEQVTPSAALGRESFVGLLALAQHVDAARAYLTRLRADDDLSGTGAGRFPVRSVVFEILLRRLGNEDQPATSALRAELRAGQLLSAGLSALSERRSQVAAARLEQLLQEHPHSFVVSLLP